LALTFFTETIRRCGSSASVLHGATEGRDMADESGSTVPRRQLGRLLRQYRTEAGVTLDGAAEQLECSRQKIWRIEVGAGPVRRLDVKAMCELYGVPPEMVDVLVTLAAETKNQGWWNAYGEAVPTWFQLFVGLEASASRLRQFEETLIPGLLQTRGYAIALFRRRPEMSEDERERAVEVRLQRQSLLARRLPPAPQFEAILSEAAVRRTIGDRTARIDQLDHLIAVNDLANISVRVLPLAVGPHRGAVAGSFVILDFPPGNGRRPVEPATVYSESLTGALYLDRPTDVAAYRDVWASLDELALDERESTKMIKQIIGEIR
jgi:hypothetical protein